MEIPTIKQKLSIKQVLHHYQLQPKNGMINCPFHEDKTPSMQVFDNSNTVRCYSGNCIHSNKTIDVIDFIMYKENITKHQAILKAGELAGMPIEQSTANSVTPLLSHSVSQRSKEYQELPIDKLEEVFYRTKNNLKQSAAARKYIQVRSLNMEKLEVGYNGRTYKGIMNCLVFPLKDRNNKIVSLYGRSIKDKGHYYLKDRTGLYPEYPKQETKILILTESIIDAASLQPIIAPFGGWGIIACYGTNGFTPEHQQAVSELKQLEEIIFAFDNDEAGEKAVKKLAHELISQYANLKISKLELPNKDVNEVLQGHDEKIFTELLNNRHTIESSSLPENKTTANNQKKEPLTQTGSSIDFLKQKHLLRDLNQLINRSGIIGEETSRLLLFLITLSYRNKHPLHALVQGSSGSGKTHIINRIADLIPPEDVLRFTRITESSLYNWGEYDLYQKVIIIEDLDGLKEEALYALREFISNQVLRSSVTIKDKKGNNKTAHKIVKGQFSSLSATTKGETYEDNMSRSFLLAVDESSEQTRRIIEYQNKKNAGEIALNQQQQAIMFIQQLLRNLKQYEVINPYATRLHLPEKVHKIRRLNEMYQAVIKQVTLLYQYQRKTTPNNQLITEIQDIEQATEILFESILLKVDELDGSLRQFFERLKAYIKNENREFILREIRQALNISKTQVFRYIQTLTELEYIKQSGGYPNKGIKYKISHWDNYQKLRTEIKDFLLQQIQKLKQEKPKGTQRNTKGTQENKPNDMIINNL